MSTVFHRRFTDAIEVIRPRLSGIRQWLCVDDGTGLTPSWAAPYETAIKEGRKADAALVPTSGDDLELVSAGSAPPRSPEFVAFAERELLPALREEYGKAEAATIRVRCGSQPPPRRSGSP
jgi:hypothetical protein